MAKCIHTHSVTIHRRCINCHGFREPRYPIHVASCLVIPEGKTAEKINEGKRHLELGDRESNAVRTPWEIPIVMVKGEENARHDRDRLLAGEFELFYFGFEKGVEKVSNKKAAIEK